MIDALQWLGAALGIAGAWLVADARPRTRAWGFALFLASNACWLAWGGVAGAWGLVAMQTAFTVTSARGWIASRRMTRLARARPAPLSREQLVALARELAPAPLPGERDYALEHVAMRQRVLEAY